MKLSGHDTQIVFSMMRDLSGDFDEAEVRHRVGQKVLELLQADYFASYVWDTRLAKFVSCVQINMSDGNLAEYESYYQFHDPITPTLQRRRQATAVSDVMAHDRLERTEFYNDFLRRDGLCYGINYFAYDRGQNIGDLRIWRSSKRNDFDKYEAELLDAIGPSFVNALVRARSGKSGVATARFAMLGEEFGLTRKECEIADLVALGLSDRELCDRLNCSKPTLRTHISAIFRKCKIDRRSQLAKLLHS